MFSPPSPRVFILALHHFIDLHKDLRRFNLYPVSNITSLLRQPKDGDDHSEHPGQLQKGNEKLYIFSELALNGLVCLQPCSVQRETCLTV